jgi:HEAT repeat protein
LGYGIVSELTDPVLRFAALTTAGAGVLIVALIASIVLVRVTRKLREWRSRRLAHDWRPLLAQCAVAPLRLFPPLGRGDRSAFLDLWNHHHELLRGEAHVNLRKLAADLNLGPYLQRMLHSVSVRKRLIAATTLGHMGSAPAVPALQQLVLHPSAPLSFAAARALMEIDATRQLPRLLPQIAQRQDWPLSRIALALRDLGADTISAPLARAALDAADSAATLTGLPRLLHLMELAHSTQVTPAVDQLLRKAAALGPEVIAACLRLLNDPRQARWARAFVTHDAWPVRVAAANALRRIGDVEDCDRLMRLLSDRYWWVRYRAAQAMAALPGVTLAEMEQVAAVHFDKFAADMLRHVAAEARLS